MITSTISFKYFFGGYYAVFNFPLKLKEYGYNVRLILVDECDFNLSQFRQEIKKYAGLESFFDQIEVGYHNDRSVKLVVSPHDQFVATSWWTAHIAHQATQELRQNGKFVYMTQEYEPLFYPSSTYYVLAEESYTFPHYALYSTEFLREYARLRGIGPFAEGIAQGNANSASFQNAILARPPRVDDLRHRASRKLLFYARPEQHASRNAFELGILAIKEALRQGTFNTHRWELHGIGSVHNVPAIPLMNNTYLKLLPKQDLKEFYETITQYDIGLCLMLAPHPSLMPLDLAAAGAISITNTFANKTADKMSAISPNLLAVKPTASAISAALAQAVERVDDVERRMAGTHLNWATTWDEAFNPQLMQKIHAWLQSPS